MGALVDDLLLHTGDTVEDDGAGSTTDIVDGGVEEGHAEGDGHGRPVDVVERIGHDDGGLTVREEAGRINNSGCVAAGGRAFS